MTPRTIVALVTVLMLGLSSPVHALAPKVLVPNTNIYMVWTPPPVVPQPPQPPSTPAMGRRTPRSVEFAWWQLDSSVISGTIERSPGKTGVWSVVKTFGALQGFQQMSDTGLVPDSLYCYRVRVANTVGSTTSQIQCVYTKESVVDANGASITRPVMRAQIRLRTGTVTNADTEDDVAVLLNSATTQYAVPALNKTWLDYPHDDFERGAEETYDLSLGSIGEIGDINMISIQKSGSDAWCLAGFDLIVNNKAATGVAPGTVLVSRSFANQPGGCLWLTNTTSTSNIVTVSFAELRATPGWYTFNPQLVPSFAASEMLSQVSSVLGNLMATTPLYWGENGGVTVTPNEAQNLLRIDADFAAGVDNAFDPDVHVGLDLLVSGGCAPDGTLSLNLEPANASVSADLSLLEAIGSFFECVGTLHGGLCVQTGVERKVGAQLGAASASMSARGIQHCIDHPDLRWTVFNNGAISLANP